MAGGGGGQEELNLVPYLDIMVNLIMFLITITAYIVEMRETPVLAPGGGGPCQGEGCDDKKPKLTLTIAVINQGIAVLSSDAAVVPAWQQDKVGDEYPVAAMQAKLREYRNSYELQDNVMLAADKQIPYKVVMQVMDGIRGDSQGPLFAGITFGQAR